jgi:hypothetical protein
MTGSDDHPEAAPQQRRVRARLVPPRLGEVERHTRGEREALRWRRGLHAERRRRLLLIGGNLLLLGVLLGVPWLRGQQRARDAHADYAVFAGCLYGGRVSGGLGELASEPEYFAAQWLRARSWPRCAPLLDAIAPAPALFLLPSVKAAEARVREALAMVRAELSAAARHVAGARLAERPLRALQLLRGTLRAQVEEAGLSDREADLPMRVASPPGFPTPARLPVYAAGDASLTLWGDDHALRALALDATGLSYLEAEPGKPLSRARLARPPLLRGLSGEGGWLLWATSPARCAARGDGCFGKTSRVAPVPAALLELPPSRALAAHAAGRPDRSIASTRAGLLLLAQRAPGRVQAQEFMLAAGEAALSELPAIEALHTWPAVLDQGIVLAVAGEPLVLGVQRSASGARLLQVGADASTPLAELGAGASWLTGCADGQRAGFAFGNGQRMLIGELVPAADGLRPRLWEEVAFGVENVIDPEAAQRDRVLRLCTPQAALVLARDASDQLTALVCRRSEPRCQQLRLASGVNAFSAVPTAHGALVAYAGEGAPQIRVRAIELEGARLGPERVPAPCWTNRGMCTRPRLARLGRRIVLVAPERTDLRALESPDDGESWSAVPAL